MFSYQLLFFLKKVSDLFCLGCLDPTFYQTQIRNFGFDSCFSENVNKYEHLREDEPLSLSSGLHEHESQLFVRPLVGKIKKKKVIIKCEILTLDFCLSSELQKRVPFRRTSLL